MSDTKYEGVIFDLDGVIVTTDEYHFQAWKKLAEEESIHFDRTINERLRGVSRMESLEIILENSSREYSDDDKLTMAERKNELYRKSLNQLTPSDILPGVKELLDDLRKRGVIMAIGSSSRNAPFILEKVGLDGFFDAVADGNMISRSKPDPEVFLLAAEKLGLDPKRCVVVEDADSGVEAALAAGCRAVAVYSASDHPGAHIRLKDLTHADAETLLG